jgi:peptidoglycan/xylan/chitin deacetylase (PgdA/CDA1 family)
VLEILEQQQVAATFFLTGMWVERYPDVTRRLAANPAFELANHTWSHRAYTANCYTLPTLPAGEMAAEITRTFDVIRPYGGHQTHYFRFPGCATTRPRWRRSRPPTSRWSTATW